METFDPKTDTFDFTKITLGNPKPIQNNSFFTKITMNNDKPLYLQMPKCLTKQAIINAKTGNFCDLMYERDKNKDLLHWIEQMEVCCQDKINENKKLWFQTEFTRDEIETMMSPIVRLYKAGQYALIRTFINKSIHTGKYKYNVYNENEESIELDSFGADVSIIPLILIDGIIFTSRSFEIDIKLIQIMVLNNSIQSICIIKKPETLLDVVVNNNEDTLCLDKVEDTLCLDKQVFNKVIDKDIVEEVQLDYNTISETIKLRRPDEVYYEIYRVARDKAKHLRKVAMDAYLEAKGIRVKYKLTEIDDSDEDEDEDEDEEEEEEEEDEN